MEGNRLSNVGDTEMVKTLHAWDNIEIGNTSWNTATNRISSAQAWKRKRNYLIDRSI